MNLIHVVILSTIEGISEFLPISSTGHMILTAKIIGLTQTEFLKSFEIAIQIGAIFAAVFLYYKKILNNFKLWISVFTAFVPTAIIGLVSYKIVKNVFFESPIIIVSALFIGGIILIITDYFKKDIGDNNNKFDPPTLRQSLIIGVAQGLSVIPGVSRAAATIIGGLFSGLSRKDAVEFSFILAIPTLGAAVILDAIKTGWKFSGEEFGLMILGTIISFFVALSILKIFIKYLNNSTLKIIGIYRIIISLLYAILFIK